MMWKYNFKLITANSRICFCGKSYNVTVIIVILSLFPNFEKSCVPQCCQDIMISVPITDREKSSTFCWSNSAAWIKPLQLKGVQQTRDKNDGTSSLQ